MSDEIPYDLKYGQLIQCLEDQNDKAWLSEYPSYIVKRFENIDRDILTSYVADLERDFHELRKLALPTALNDGDLAKRLLKIEDAMLRFKRALQRPQFSVFADAHVGLRSLLRKMQELHFLGDHGCGAHSEAVVWRDARSISPVIDEFGYDLVDLPGVSVEETVFEPLSRGAD
jgi:hypothetical protein